MGRLFLGITVSFRDAALERSPSSTCLPIRFLTRDSVRRFVFAQMCSRFVRRAPRHQPAARQCRTRKRAMPKSVVENDIPPGAPRTVEIAGM